MTRGPDDELQRAVGRLEAKVDILLARSESRDERIAKLEHDATAQKAVVGVIATIAGGVSAFASRIFGLT